ncbi:hypothetical protein BU16DRAFT_196299 [Lophium mytilinum]|uniref:Uncharacterized protein n=1 Tax=Lophium mytilinum TaxID=390894 RepID=A0A6A6R948_9PEZI|nr:hypothetical protein BU16DRAFT_196299 [Lophium mytilinum]
MNTSFSQYEVSKRLTTHTMCKVHFVAFTHISTHKHPQALTTTSSHKQPQVATSSHK